MKKKRDTIIIKRYASRRLYNTETSEYVTLDEVAQFIRDGLDVQIVDRKTGDDLTRQYLMQIITDYESRGENVLPVNVLTDIVRSYNDQAQNFIPDFLSQSYEMLKQQQQEVLNSIQKNVTDTISPIAGIPGIEEAQQWQQMQTEFFNQMMSAWTPTPTPEEKQTNPKAEPKQKTTAKKTADSKDKDKQAELDKIQQQLQDLQSKLQNMQE